MKAKKNKPLPPPKIPHSPEAEAGVLGGLLLAPERMPDVVDTGVAPDDFYSPQYRAIANAIWRVWSGDGKLDPVSIYERVRDEGHEKFIGGYKALIGLSETVPNASEAKAYAKIVRDKSLLRKYIDACEEMLYTAKRNSRPVSEIIAEGAEGIFSLQQHKTGVRATRAGEVSQRIIHNFDSGVPETALKTGYADIDHKLCGGLRKGEMIVIAGRPSMGKSALALNMARHVAIKSNNTVVIFTLETTEKHVALHFMTQLTGISAYNLYQGVPQGEWMDRLMKANKRINGSNVLICDKGGATLFDIKTVLRKTVAVTPIDLVIVDYLQRMTPPKESKNSENDALTALSGGLHNFAKEFDVPMLVLSQLSRHNEYRSDRRPRLADLRGSGAIEQNADVVMLLYRDDYYKKNGEPNDNIAEVNVAKQKVGPTGIVKLYFNRECLRFENIGWEQEIDDEPKFSDYLTDDDEPDWLKE